MQGVLVTRPLGQQLALGRGLDELAIPWLHLPLLAVEEVPENQQQKELVMGLDQFDGVITLSPNGARIAMARVDRYWPMLPVGLHWLANGPGTAKVLNQWQVHKVQTPTQGTTSEDLLKLPVLQEVQEQKWLLIKGEGGRPLLKDTLESRQAQVTEWACYRRVKPAVSTEAAQTALSQCAIIMISSAEALDNLYGLIKDNQAFKHHKAVVSSQRLKEKILAGPAQWQSVVIAQGASDSQMIQAVSLLFK